MGSAASSSSLKSTVEGARNTSERKRVGCDMQIEEGDVGQVRMDAGGLGGKK
jgi:hypothetical protein